MATEASDEEINIVKKSIKPMMADFAPEKYSNGRRQKLLDIVNKKARKKDEVEAPEIEEEEKAEGMADLMTALEKSMRAVKKSGPVKHGKN